MDMSFSGIRQWWQNRRLNASLGDNKQPASWRKKTAYAVIAVFLIVQLGFAWYWSREPDLFWIQRGASPTTHVVGYASTDTLIRVATTLLEKPGGYLSNDIAPPGVLLDNIPSWELGVLTQVRDLARVLRNDYSRSQSQSTEDPGLSTAEPAFNFTNDSWILPASESKYREGIKHLNGYLLRLQDPVQSETQFFARADNLREWLAVVEKRLGSLSQRLSASVGRRRLNTDLAGEESASQSTVAPSEVDVSTPWMEIDDVFYEARGTAWALIQLPRACIATSRAATVT